MSDLFLMLLFVAVYGAMSQKSILLEYDFEGRVPEEISAASTLSTTNTQHKNGLKSLEWAWTSGETITWDLSTKPVRVTRSGGIKIWIYISSPVHNCLSVCFRETLRPEESSPTRVSCFPMSLNFQGWRAAWVAYKEFRGCSLPSPRADSRKASSSPNGLEINQLTLTAPAGTLTRTLHVDLLRFVATISRETRDSIVPPLTYVRSAKTHCMSCANILDEDRLNDDDVLARYGRKTHWQQIYRWSLKPIPSSSVSTARLGKINLIARRLVNWYANEATTYTRIPCSAPSNIPEHRWDSLLENIDEAHEELVKFKRGTTLASGLFSRNSKFGSSTTAGGDKKFSTLFYKVLLPLSLEYFIKSRPIEEDHVACAFATEHSCSPGSVDRQNIEPITGKNIGLQDTFIDSYQSRIDPTSSTTMRSGCSAVKTCFDKVKKAIKAVNNDRKNTILELFEYVKDQGWDKGGALGSFDHEILGMSGFAHSVFLMREELTSAGQINDVMKTMKWYAQFGEIYQERFEYTGSTADRIRTLMFFRLLTVLAMPERTVAEQKEKVRDMDALKLWIENALTINKGLDGFIKPDFTCFHHRTFYASAYTPPALHTAALISYLLKDTEHYQLNPRVSSNLENALKTLRIVAVHYSTPSAVGGRFPNYTRAVLAEHLPAYAYIAAVPPVEPATSDPLGPIRLSSDSELVRMFLRLYDLSGTSSDILNKRLYDGAVPRKYYLNTLGSLQIMANVSNLARDHSPAITAEAAPDGHWSKQFAALSIHRRRNWAVTVKGFDKFVWDFEKSASPDENLYGMYTSHGAMLIANNESALRSKDVDNGWDWRKIPGTTVISTDFPKMLTTGDRHYGNSTGTMAGGVTFKGSTSALKKNGVFGMNFIQPSYPSYDFCGVTFRFKKSVFFYDDIIVSLGSNIEYSGGKDEVHTTLFQDKMMSTSRTTDEEGVYRCNDNTPSKIKCWDGRTNVTLVDVNGNRYYIPHPDKQGLVLWRNQPQVSVKSRGKDIPSYGLYCTAWFNHGKGPSGNSQYEYAVQVHAEPISGTRGEPKFVLSDRYKVMQQNGQAHVVNFVETGTRGSVHGYVVFPTASLVDLGSCGPLRSVKGQSIIMVEEKTSPTELYMSVASPQLNLRKKPGPPAYAWCPERTTSPSKYDDVEETLLFCSESKGQQVHVKLNNRRRTLQSLMVGEVDKMPQRDDYLQEPDSSKSLEFINLKNGISTEAFYQ